MSTALSSEMLWSPAAHAWTADSNIARFMRQHGFTSLEQLIERSHDEPEWFWDAMSKWIGVVWDTPYSAVMDASDPPFTTWYTGGKLNLVRTCVDRFALGRAAARPAVIWDGEDGGSRCLSFADLRREVALLADALDKLGVKPGDAVGIYLPMIPEIVVALYACASIGAMAVPIFSGFAAPAVASRLEHSQAKVVLTADGTLRKGKQVAMKTVVDEAVEGLDCVQHVVVARRLGLELKLQPGRDLYWHAATEGCDASRQPASLDSEHPFLLAYTSGTTGAPKAAVHVHGGFLVKIAEEANIQADIREGDIVHWVTDMGWIMGPWKTLGAHANGASLVLAEGAPDHPNPGRIWEMTQRHHLTFLGVSPTLVRGLMQQGDEHVASHDLSSLRCLGSTGEPWNPDPWRWLLNVAGGGRCPIVNISGGTEVGAGFLGPTPLTPLKPCTLGGPMLGMAMEVRDPEGNVLGPGDGVGELVCTKPWPGMTRGFWGEGGRERYLETYWTRWPGAWTHGDWASIDEDGLWFLHGRSDDTMNIAGKRIGPAEYESILVSHPDVAESAAIAVPDEVKGEACWCYVVLADGARASDKLRTALSGLVGDELGKAFKPGRILFTKALPKTRSAKIVRRAIRAAALGKEIGDTSMVENPDAIDAIRSAN